MNPGGWSLVILFAAAALEYMVPPLPADSIVLAGSLLVVAGTWSFGSVALVVIAGGLLGSAVHYFIGRALVADDGRLRGGRWLERLTGRGSIERFFEVFRERGIWVIAINRMFPGIRAGVFLAAGAARLPVVTTLLLGLVSNVIWSCAILGVGVLIGGNLSKLEALLGVYKGVALAVVVVAIIGFALLSWRRKTR